MKEVGVRKEGFLTRKILRALRIDRRFVWSPSTQEEGLGVNIPADYNGWASIKTALLEAERKKAEGFMERQNRSFVC